MDLQVSSRPGRECTVVQVHGELDMDTRPVLEDVLRDAVDEGARQVVLDVAGVPFMDSSGLGLLVLTIKRLNELGGRLCLARAQAPIRNVLALSAVDTVLTVYDSVEAAESDMPPVAA